MPEDLTGSRMRGGYVGRNPVVGLFDFRVPDEPWMEQGVCKTTDPEAFFPENGSSARDGKRVCRGCPVVAECLEYALTHNERHGIWGAASERDRRKMLRARRLRAAS